MGDTTYQPKVYRRQGGDVLVVASGGKILVEPGGLFMGGNPTGAADYFVDLNVSATGDGSAESPFATIAEAITASNTSIGLTANRWWARRNRIFVMGDGIAEDLTVLPEKCDVIGCGADLYPFPRVIGAHTIALAKVGCRFINMGWQATGTGDLFVIPASCHGLQFIGGVMIPSTAGNTKALEITSSALVRIADVRIVPNAGAPTVGIFGEGIALEGTAAGHECELIHNRINATVGIHVAASHPATGSLMEENIIHATGLTINDESLLYQVVNNRLMTDVDIDSDTTLGIVCAPELACGNIVTGSGTAGTSDWYPWAKVSA